MEVWMPNYRIDRRLATAIFVLVLSWSVWAAAASPKPDHITLTWSGDPKITQTITWRTDASVTAGEVRYGYCPENPAKFLSDVKSEDQLVMLETAAGQMNIHSVVLQDLLPGKEYCYEVGNGDFWSGRHAFRTAPRADQPFSFLVFGDSQSLDYQVWRTSLNTAKSKSPNAAFFINMGDLVDVGQDIQQWEYWFAAARGVIEKIPVMPLTGNHECYTLDRRFSRPVFFTAQFTLPENGPAEMKRQVYSFDYGDVHFVMLDSQEGEQRHMLPEMLQRQRDWLEIDLAASNRKWKLVFIHRPIYGNKPDGINETLRQAFEEVLERNRVDAVFTAHDHVYARTAVTPDRRTIHVATGRTGTKTYSDVEGKAWNEFFHNPQKEPLYLIVGVERDALRLQAWELSGRLIDEWLIDKTEESQSLYDVRVSGYR